MSQDRFDAFVLGARKWAEASDGYGAAATELATALRDLADEVEADPVLMGAVSVTQIRDVATLIEAKAQENRDTLLAMEASRNLIDGLKDHNNPPGIGSGQHTQKARERGWVVCYAAEPVQD